MELTLVWDQILVSLANQNNSDIRDDFARDCLAAARIVVRNHGTVTMQGLPQNHAAFPDPLSNLEDVQAFEAVLNEIQRDRRMKPVVQ